MTEDSHNDAGLVFVLSGSLELSQCTEEGGGGGGSAEEEERAGHARFFYGGAERQVILEGMAAVLFTSSLSFHHFLLKHLLCSFFPLKKILFTFLPRHEGVQNTLQTKMFSICQKHFVSPPHQDPRGAGSASSISERVLYTAFRGECVGQLAMLTGEANFYNCKAKETSRVAIITR